MKKEAASNVRYFIVRSYNFENIQISIRTGAWATTLANEEKFERAFSSGHEVREEGYGVGACAGVASIMGPADAQIIAGMGWGRIRHRASLAC